jgi:hypothetical protein
MTTDADLQWWRDALAGKSPPIHSTPQCGLYKRKIVRGGAWVAARIYKTGERDDLGRLIEDEQMHCDVDGKPVDNPDDAWLWLADNPIDEVEYKMLMRLGPWARQHAPTDPNADPTKAIDFMTAPIPAFKQRRKRA